MQAGGRGRGNERTFAKLPIRPKSCLFGICRFALGAKKQVFRPLRGTEPAVPLHPTIKVVHLDHIHAVGRRRAA